MRLTHGVIANPAGPRGGPAAELKRLLEALVPKLGASWERRIDADDTQALIEATRQIIGAPRQALEVTAEPTAAYRELLASTVQALAAAGRLGDVPAIDAEVRLLPPAKQRRQRQRRPKP